MIEDGRVFNTSRRIAYRRIGDQMVLVSPEENVMLTLNPTGTAVWEGLDGRQSVAEIAAALEQKFEVTAEQAFGDVVTFLELLLERGLIEKATVSRDS
jgi:coenzyme PQQ biosynthesis protein PqqD